MERFFFPKAKDRKTNPILLICMYLCQAQFHNAQDANLIWAKSMGSSNNDYGQTISVDGFGNVYTTGYFTGTADFDPGPAIYNLTSASGSSDIFVTKVDPSGN